MCGRERKRNIKNRRKREALVVAFSTISKKTRKKTTENKLKVYMRELIGSNVEERVFESERKRKAK